VQRHCPKYVRDSIWSYPAVEQVHFDILTVSAARTRSNGNVVETPTVIAAGLADGVLAIDVTSTRSQKKTSMRLRSCSDRLSHSSPLMPHRVDVDYGPALLPTTSRASSSMPAQSCLLFFLGPKCRVHAGDDSPESVAQPVGLQLDGILVGVGSPDYSPIRQLGFAVFASLLNVTCSRPRGALG